MKKQSGQAMLEFVLTLTLLMGFTLFYVQTTLAFAWGNYVHYATFMAARALLSAGLHPGEQEARAKAVIDQMLRSPSGNDRLKFVSQGFDENDSHGLSIFSKTGTPHPLYRPTGDPNYSWLEGVRYRFKSRLFLLPFGGNRGALEGQWSPANTLDLKSESWLGRDPTEDECSTYMKGINGNAFQTLDNGC